MKLQTQIQLPNNQDLQYHHNFLIMGSCFAENIGKKFLEYHFNAQINPFGIAYNPSSIAIGLKKLLDPTPFTKKDLFFDGNLFHSWLHHGRFSKSKIEDALHIMNQELITGSQQLKKTDCLIITFGSSMVWNYQGQIVANCHKQPAKLFSHKRIDLIEIITGYTSLFSDLIHHNNKLKIKLTISPVRYFGDSTLEAQTNKAILFLAVEALCKQFKEVSYFPAYEIVMDELRDYRFYADDLIHPSSLAINYIWEKWCESEFTKKTCLLMPQIEKIHKGITHKPLHPESPEFQKFQDSLKTKIEKIKREYPNLKF